MAWNSNGLNGELEEPLYLTRLTQRSRHASGTLICLIFCVVLMFFLEFIVGEFTKHIAFPCGGKQRFSMVGGKDVNRDEQNKHFC